MEHYYVLLPCLRVPFGPSQPNTIVESFLCFCPKLGLLCLLDGLMCVPCLSLSLTVPSFEAFAGRATTRDTAQMPFYWQHRRRGRQGPRTTMACVRWRGGAASATRPTTITHAPPPPSASGMGVCQYRAAGRGPWFDLVGSALVNHLGGAARGRASVDLPVRAATAAGSTRTAHMAMALHRGTQAPAWLTDSMARQIPTTCREARAPRDSSAPAARISARVEVQAGIVQLSTASASYPAS